MTICGIPVPVELVGRSFLMKKGYHGAQWMSITDYLDIVAWGGDKEAVQREVDMFMAAVEEQRNAPASIFAGS